MPEEPEVVATSGEMTSPFFPGNYPHNMDLIKTIQATEGHRINIRFTDFDLDEEADGYDYVAITEGDGRYLASFGPGAFNYWYKNHQWSDAHGGTWHKEKTERAIKALNLTSVTDTVHVRFYSDGEASGRGWRLEWSK